MSTCEQYSECAKCVQSGQHVCNAACRRMQLVDNVHGTCSYVCPITISSLLRNDLLCVEWALLTQLFTLYRTIQVYFRAMVLLWFMLRHGPDSVWLLIAKDSTRSCAGASGCATVTTTFQRCMRKCSTVSMRLCSAESYEITSMCCSIICESATKYSTI